MIAGHFFDPKVDEKVTKKPDDRHQSGFLGSKRDKDYRTQNKWHMGKPFLIPRRPQNAQKPSKTKTFQNPTSNKNRPFFFLPKSDLPKWPQYHACNGIWPKSVKIVRSQKLGKNWNMIFGAPYRQRGYCFRRCRAAWRGRF